MQLFRLIIIEDDEDTKRALMLSIKASQDILCEIITTDRLQAGLGILIDTLKHPEDVGVILDLGLPDSEGVRLNAVNLVRQVSNKLFLIVLTGSISISEAREGYRLGADAVREKPVSHADLIWLIVSAQEVRRRHLLRLEEKENEIKDLRESKMHRSLPVEKWWQRAGFWKIITGVLAALSTLIAALSAFKK